VASHLKSQVESLQRIFEVVCVIDEERRLLDRDLLVELA
jgi:hypothetical protein